MADNPHIYGLRYAASRNGIGGPIVERAYVASAYQASVSPGPVNCDLSVGDPVIKVNDGTVAMATGAAAIYGVVSNVLPFFDSVKQQMAFGKQLPGGTTYGTNPDRQSIVEIIVAAGNVFEVDCDDNVTATTQLGYRAFIGENANVVFQPNATTRQANPFLDISTHATTNTLPFRIVDISKYPNQDFSGLNVKLYVTANLVQQAPFTPLGV